MKHLPKAILVPLVLIVVFYTMQALGVSIPLRVATTTSGSGDFSVVGEGKVEVVPDVAYIDVGVVTDNVATAKEAQEQIAQSTNTLKKAVSKFGISEKDIKTTNYSINPNYDYSAGGAGRIVGYTGSSQLSLTIRKIADLPKVIEASTSSSANQIYNTRYAVGEPSKYREEARTKAIENAKEQANRLASQLGIRLGKVTNVIETSVNPGVYQPVMMDRMMGGGGGSSADLSPGQETIYSTVTLYFEKR